MFSKKLIVAGLIAATTLTAVPANAGGLAVQFGFGADSYGPGIGWKHGPYGPAWQHHRLSPQEVRYILHREGYRNIRFLDARGPVYQVHARRFGRSFFLVVSARDGDILARHRA
jgi:hypothetical protein